jgi:hypothetical protein
MKLNNQITKLATAARCELSVMTRAGDCHWHAVELMDGGYRQGTGKTAKQAIELMKLAPIVKTTN